MSLIARRPARAALPDAGPSPVRYLGVLGGAATAVLVTAVLMPVAGHAVRAGLCGEGDTGCATLPIAPEAACHVLSHADVVPDDAVVFTDDLGSSGRLTLARTVDKNAVVHWFVRRDDVPGSVRGGEVTEFPTQAAARAYITAAQHEPVRERLRAADPTGLMARIAGAVDGHPLPGEMVATPHATFVDAGSALDLGAQARSGVTGPLVSGGVTGVAEVRVTHEARPVTTLFVELSPSAATALRLRGYGPGMTVASIAFDRQGSPEQLVVESAGQLRGWLTPAADTGSDLLTRLLDESAPTELPPFTGRVTIRIDLRDPGPTDSAGNAANADLAADALHELGVPLLLDRGDADPDAVTSLYRELDAGRAGTSVTVSAYRSENASPEVGLGLQGGLTVKGARPGDDFYYAPGQGLVRWQTCGP
ncbi:hypothetical protein [Kineosporia succinea]|uniref:Uncharacterized protein n=1 Tax=Kineosporia succinea TaxID=84632 RepID=A0ABT9P1P9_9ACTN|nr:hypothetical protein [Kineosporia succinea]MDP9826609.1 hypothetical protein [Kineosporia succinea]